MYICVSQNLIDIHINQQIAAEERLARQLVRDQTRSTAIGALIEWLDNFIQWLLDILDELARPSETLATYCRLENVVITD